jgi:nucleoside 2-deoxyribosyltransferase
MKIYLAASYDQMELMRRWEKVLHEYGHECTARWIHNAEENEKMTLAAAALMDLDDIDAADCIISYNNGKSTRGGRHVEFGYALARGKEMIIVGERESVFHHLSNIEVFPTIMDVMIYFAKFPTRNGIK